MTPIPEYLNLASKEEASSALAICAQELIQVRRRKKIIEFPQGSSYCFLLDSAKGRKSIEFVSNGGLVIPFKDINPFYFCSPENLGDFPPILKEFGLEDVELFPEEKNVALVISKEGVKVSVKIKNEEGRLNETTRMAISALLFLDPNQLRSVHNCGILVGEYLPEEGVNCVRGYVVFVPTGEKNGLFPLKLKEYLGDNSDCLPSGRIPKGAPRDLGGFFRFPLIVASWKKI